jgi:hypothetical protein
MKQMKMMANTDNAFAHGLYRSVHPIRSNGARSINAIPCFIPSHPDSS